jgi:hypothetical protein
MQPQTSSVLRGIVFFHSLAWSGVHTLRCISVDIFEHPRTGVILNDFSREGSRAYCIVGHGIVHMRCAPDPSQAQDDPFHVKGRN